MRARRTLVVTVLTLVHSGTDGSMIIAILNTNGGTIPDNCQG
jgi:hypothetical protein